MEQQNIEGYFDYNATTPLSPDVIHEMTAVLTRFANCSSNSSSAVENKNLLKKARSNIKEFLGAKAGEVYFTSGGSEANNWAIKGTLLKHIQSPGHIITSEIEHASVLDTVKYCSDELGFDVTYVKPDKNGVVSVDEIIASLRPDTQLVSIMYANNETGVIQPVNELSRLLHEKNIIFHVDGVQVVGKRKVDVEKLDVDLLSFSAHKFYGPKGIGGLYVKNPSALTPLIHGGGQEMSMRSGTENLVAICGVAKAAEEAIKSLDSWDEYYWKCKQLLIDRLNNLNIGIKFNGYTDYENSISNTINITIPGVRGEALAAILERKHGFVVSIGSACSNNKSKSLSHVLQAMDLSETDIQSSIRISVGLFTDASSIERFVSCLKSSIDQLVGISGSV